MKHSVFRCDALRMYRWFIFFSALAVANAWLPTIDKNVFKNCSRISFCTTLRHHVLEESSKYSADLKSVSITNNIVNIPLKNSDGKLNLQISILEGNKARVKIAETDSKRFELNDIIIVENLKELELEKSNVDENKISFRSVDESYPQSIVVTQGPPFTVEFYYNGDLRVVLNADRILMESTKDSQVFTFGVEFEGSDKLYGLFHHAYQLALKETMDDSSDPFRLRNSDSWAYEANSPMALYGAVPAIYGHSTNKTSGIFLHNAAEQWIDISYKTPRPSAYFMVEGAAFDLFVLLGPTPKDLVRQITTMTGKAHMPQIWTLGYHQCRFSYKSQDDVETVVALMDKHNFPFDAIWLDGDHTDDYRWFRWNHTTYSDPVGLQKNISATGRKCVSISDPHIAVDKNYSVYMGAKDKYFVKWANGTNYEADCWPGLSSWIDYMIPEASDYYASWYAFDKFNGSTPTLAGIWNDMNEPAVFDDSIEKTLPFEVLHNGSVKHGDIHNIYGFMQARSTHKGLMDRDEHKKRPFILTRSTFVGSQRFAAMWTGDNSATWDHFANTYPECMTANLMGMVFCGADIGGFIGDPSDELLMRWYQGAAWTTFFRGHSSRESKRREPYLFSEDVQTVIRNAIIVRYQHIPVFYTLFYEHTRTGDPILRPLFYQYPDIYERDNQMLIGTDIMAVAVTKPNISSLNVLIPGSPEEHWYRVDREDQWPVYRGGKEIDTEVNISSSPYYYRAGSIFLRKDDFVNSTTDAADRPYTLYVNLDKNVRANGHIYKDDFISFDYTEKNSYLYLNVTFNPDDYSIVVRQIDGDHSGILLHVKSVVLHQIVNPEKGKLESSETRYTETANGTPLASIDIGNELKRLKGDKGAEVIIPLKKLL